MTTPHLNDDVFKEALKAATREVITTFRRFVPYETLYVFLLYTNGEGSYVLPSLNTEQGLLRGTERYTEDRLYSGGPELIATMNRWSPCDWVYHTWGEEFFATVDEHLCNYCWTVTPNAEGYNNYEFNFDTEPQQVYRICLEALAELDAEELFGTGEERERLTVGLFMGDQSNEQRVEWARQVNPPSVSERLETELNARGEAFRTWSDLRRQTRSVAAQK